MPNVGDELHHSGWNICSSCYDSPKKRDTLVLPGLISDRVYFIDVSEEKKPKIKKVRKLIYKKKKKKTGRVQRKLPNLRTSFSNFWQILEPEEMHKWGIATPHTTHCSPTGEIIISTMGNLKGDPVGSFLTIDSTTLETTGLWSKDAAGFGYDFWYQPYHDILISSEWAAPRVLKDHLPFENMTPGTVASLNPTESFTLLVHFNP